MNKSDLIEALSMELDLPIPKSEDIVDRLFDTMSQTLASGGRIEVRGFGSFAVKEYHSYTGRNPKTGEATVVKPKKLPCFKIGKGFKDNLNRE